ncbi:MAG: inverse autotransporter beta domain-containing protein [Alphaproteobacteria bacterium]|nr:inverse autotransporter beta domain-containing protein [Alphaproteobacteria bacterium]
MNELWVPLAQGPTGRSVVYGDLRLMGDDGDNREGNLGLGYRQITSAPVLGEGVVGVHGWLDRRLTERGSTFHQVTLGGEWLGRDVDVLANAYVPLSSQKEYEVSNPNAHGPELRASGMWVSTNATVLEEPQGGFDLELGWRVPFLEEYTDSVRVYGGGYYFDGDHTPRMTGWRTRLAADITPDFQIGARFQKDDERGSQGFLEATIRFPFGQKKSYRRDGLKARLDDSPERDIDIVTGGVTVDPGRDVPVINKDTGKAQEVYHVDNTAAAGG